MSATKGGGEEARQMLTLADEGGRGGLANDDSTDKMIKKGLPLISFFTH